MNVPTKVAGFFLLTWLPLALGATCNPPTPEPTPVPPEPEVDAGPSPEPEQDADPPAPKATCEGACARMRALDCPVGEPTPEGRTCEETCTNVETGPIDSVKWDLACLARASSCQACDAR